MFESTNTNELVPRLLCVCTGESHKYHISTGIFNVIYAEWKPKIIEISEKRYIWRTLYMVVDPCTATILKAHPERLKNRKVRAH